MPAMRPARKSNGRRSFMDIGRKLRKVERQTGATLELFSASGLIVALDPETGMRFEQFLGSPSQHETNIKRLHETIYHKRGEEKLRQQGFTCALCGLPLDGTSNTSIDHIESRGAHGRSDAMSNIRVVHQEPCHRERHEPKRERIKNA